MDSVITCDELTAEIGEINEPYLDPLTLLRKELDEKNVLITSLEEELAYAYSKLDAIRGFYQHS